MNAVFEYIKSYMHGEGAVLVFFIASVLMVMAYEYLKGFFFRTRPVVDEYPRREPMLRTTEEYLIKAKNAALLERNFYIAAEIRGVIRKVHDEQDKSR